MEKTLIKTRRFNKETYSFYLYTPSYIGEKGCCGIEIKPYIEVETPENDFGYSDYIHFRKKENNEITCYTTWRYECPWIKKELCKNMVKLVKKYEIQLL